VTLVTVERDLYHAEIAGAGLALIPPAFFRCLACGAQSAVIEITAKLCGAHYSDGKRAASADFILESDRSWLT
jgi:hypothetical protein